MNLTLLVHEIDDRLQHAGVELGQHAFAWRLPGVIAGTLMAAFLYVLARVLFRRREITVVAGVLALLPWFQGS